MSVKDWLENRKFVTLLVLILLVVLFPWQVQVGEEAWCRFGHLVERNVLVKWVPWWLSYRYKVAQKSLVCDEHLQAQRLLLEAEKEMEAGNYRRAVEILEMLVENFPTPEAKEALARARKGLEEAGGMSGEITSTGASGKAGFSQGTTSSGSFKPTRLLKKALLPDVLLYYKGGSLLEEKNYISRAYLPPVEGDIQTLAVTVYELSSPVEASEQFGLGKEIFPDNARFLKIENQPAYFGTFNVSACLYIQYDNVVFEVISKSKGEPREIENYVKEVGEELIKMAQETWTD